MSILTESFIDKAQIKQVAEIRGEPTPFFKLQKEEIDVEVKTLKIDVKIKEGQFILGHPCWGILGVSRLGGNLEIPLGVFRIKNPKNTFEEDFASKEFLKIFPSYCRFQRIVQFI